MRTKQTRLPQPTLLQIQYDHPQYVSNDPSQQRHLEKEKPFCSQVFAKSITALTLPNYVHLLQNPSHHGLEKISLPLPTPSCLTLA